jgi:hypothetical protein
MAQRDETVSSRGNCRSGAMCLGRRNQPQMTTGRVRAGGSLDCSLAFPTTHTTHDCTV